MSFFIDVEAELALLRATFEQTRNQGREFAPMAVAITVVGQHVPIVSNSKEMAAVAAALSELQAAYVLICRDAWYNTAGLSGGFVRPSLDPGRREALSVIYAAKSDSASYFYPYHMTRDHKLGRQRRPDVGPRTHAMGARHRDGPNRPVPHLNVFLSWLKSLARRVWLQK